MATRNPDLIKVCPAKCLGGYESEQRGLYQGQKDCMPEDLLETAKGGLQYCRYCHAVWEDREGGKKLYGFLENDKFRRHKMILG
jgi:hypothetical protein